MILETILSTAVTEYLRKFLPKKKRQNNVKKIHEMKTGDTEFRTVGELRELLNNFSDDVPVVCRDNQYMYIQIFEIENEGYALLQKGETIRGKYW